MIQPSRKFAERIWLSVPHMGGEEARAVQLVLSENDHLAGSDEVERLETEFSALTKLPALAVSNGTAAIHLALRLAGVQSGDEVVAPTLTFAGCINPIIYQQGIPVFIDSDLQSWNMDPALTEKFFVERARKNRLPRALILVNLCGQNADVDPFVQLCQRYDVRLIEDAAQSLGAVYKGRPSGVSGEFGVYSFNGNKTITGTAGGMLVAKNPSDIDRARRWITEQPEPTAIGGGGALDEVGYGYEMSGVIAAIIRRQLPLLDQRVHERRAVFARYEQEFAAVAGLTMQPEAQFGSSLPSRHSRWLSCMTVDPSEFGMPAANLVSCLDAANIETRMLWTPMHLQPLYRDREIIGGSIAQQLSARAICLPSSSSLTIQEQTFIIEQVKDAHTSGH